MKIFINYRRQDTAAYAHLLRDRLARRFESENVFLDVVDLRPGMNWLEEIKSRGESSAVFIAIIGPQWLSSMTARADARFDKPIDDVVKQEIEFALGRRSALEVIPVLVGDATMPPADKLPKSLRPLTLLQAAYLRHDKFDADVDLLLARLDEIRQHESDSPPDPSSSPVVELAANETFSEPTIPARIGATRQSPVAPQASVEPPPGDTHYDSVLSYMLDPRSVVPILGPNVNESDSIAALGAPGTIPNSKLAADIAARFGLDLAPMELARVAQHVFVTSGPPDLHAALKRLLAVESAPSQLHRFLAHFPARLEDLGETRRYQMIVTTNYDIALEQAFDQANEPYDMAVYMASGIDRGRFVHFPYDRAPEPIAVPNRYGKLPIDDDGELARTLIVKVHGAIDGTSGDYRWKENYVITEDHYIEYLSHSSVESLVPIQILDKLTSSHCLFLGYPLGEWSLRVFLRRVWQGGRIEAKSWAIEEAPQTLERDFWRQFDVELFATSLGQYVEGLQRRLAARPPIHD